MKRVLLSVLGTVAGLVALLDFKSHGAHPLGASSLPTASLPAGGGAATTAPAGGAGSSAAAGPSRSRRSPAPSGSSSASAARTFTGQAIQTQYGVVQVKVTVQGDKITNVGFAQLTADDFRSQSINQDAAPILLQETLQAQSAQVDTVSGASYTSEGYRQSLQSALDQAGFQ